MFVGGLYFVKLHHHNKWLVSVHLRARSYAFLREKGGTRSVTEGVRVILGLF